MALKYGNALCFNGASQYASRAVASTVNNNFSVILWVYVRAYGSGDVSFFNNGATDGNGYVMRMGNTGVFSFDMSFIANLSSGFTLSVGTWYQLAVIRNAGTSQCYVNAAAQGGTSASSPNNPGSFSTVGASQVAAGTAAAFANAVIDDVRLYERAITTGELTTLYSMASDPSVADISSTSLRLWLKLDALAGTSAVDSSGNSLTFTTTATPFFTQGIISALTPDFRLRPSRPRPFAPGLAR